MTLGQFQKLLTKVHPRLKLKIRSYGDIVGVYGNGSYIMRMTKGEFNFNGWRLQHPNPQDPLNPINGRIMKRGRKTVVNILRSHRWATNHQDRTMLLYGVIKK
jgi:hypothetical protein